MESKHTKTPWTVANSGMTITAEFPHGYVEICTLETDQRKMSPKVEANAHHIVKCVNAHDELVRVLQSIADDYDSLKSITSNPNHTAIAITARAKKVLQKLNDNTPIIQDHEK